MSTKEFRIRSENEVVYAADVEMRNDRLEISIPEGILLTQGVYYFECRDPGAEWETVSWPSAPEGAFDLPSFTTDQGGLVLALDAT